MEIRRIVEEHQERIASLKRHSIQQVNSFLQFQVEPQLSHPSAGSLYARLMLPCLLDLCHTHPPASHLFHSACHLVHDDSQVVRSVQTHLIERMKALSDEATKLETFLVAVNFASILHQCCLWRLPSSSDLVADVIISFINFLHTQTSSQQRFLLHTHVVKCFLMFLLHRIASLSGRMQWCEDAVCGEEYEERGKEKEGEEEKRGGEEKGKEVEERGEKGGWGGEEGGWGGEEGGGGGEEDVSLLRYLEERMRNEGKEGSIEDVEGLKEHLEWQCGRVLVAMRRSCPPPPYKQHLLEAIEQLTQQFGAFKEPSREEETEEEAQTEEETQTKRQTKRSKDESNLLTYVDEAEAQDAGVVREGGAGVASEEFEDFDVGVEDFDEGVEDFDEGVENFDEGVDDKCGETR